MISLYPLKLEKYPNLVQLGFLLVSSNIISLGGVNNFWKRKVSYFFPLDFQHASTIKARQKKENQKEGGKIGQQNGELYKGKLIGKLMLKKGVNLSQNINVVNLLNALTISMSSVDSIAGKSLEDVGAKDDKCAKADLMISIKYNSNKKETFPLSLKSTHSSTQVAIHPLVGFLNDFNKYINPSYLTVKDGAIGDELIKEKLRIKLNLRKYREANLFLYLFTHLNDRIVKPCKESIRRQRHSIEEINTYNPQLVLSFMAFFEDNYIQIIEYITFNGKNSQKSAKIIAFFNQKKDTVKFFSKDHVLNFCKNSLNKITMGKKNSDRGTTTFFIADGLISLQMKGSGKIGSAEHKNLQFKITGNKLK